MIPDGNISMNLDIPRIVIGGTHSGVGKTTITMAMIAALREKGLAVQPFKVGPDYLDTTYHTVVAGRRCRNLDGWMTDRGYVEAAFARASADADIAVVEGVMGMFDGLSPASEEGSTAQMAKWLQAPLILIADAAGMARSAAAVAKGYSTFDPSLPLAGVIFNNVGSPSHLALLREAVEAGAGVRVLGGLPAEKKIELPHRHLGLVTADMKNLSGELLSSLTEMLLQWVDLEAVIALARSAPPLKRGPHRTPLRGASCRIAVAMDEAFHFYYVDNMELLEEAGAELVFFSPVKDESLPPGITGIYLGGGYPEVHAAALEANEKMRSAIAHFARDGGPIYAECGGLMYLCQSIRTTDGKLHRMAGVLPMRTAMLKKLSALRYVEVTARQSNPIAEPGAVFRGHEFHYSRLEEELLPGRDSVVRLTYDVRGRKAEDRLLEGYSINNVLASYIHLHFGSNPTLAGNFVKTCISWSTNRLHTPHQRPTEPCPLETEEKTHG